MFDIAPMTALALAILGLVVGFFSGLLGIGGAFILTPVMIAFLGIDSSIAVGCSLGYSVGVGLIGLRKHSQLGNVEWKSMVTLGTAAASGTLIGFALHQLTAYLVTGGTSSETTSRESFDTVMTGLFVLLLIPIAFMVWRQPRDTGKPALLSRINLPPTIQLTNGNVVSLTGLILAGLTVGVLKGMFGIGGVILIPILVLVVGLTPHVSVGTSLGAVFISSTVGTLIYGLKGQLDFVVIACLLVGSICGVHVGARVCSMIDGRRLRRWFAVVVAGFCICLAWDVVHQLNTGNTSTKTGSARLDDIRADSTVR